MPTRTVGRYRLTKQLGIGMFSKVMIGVDDETGTQYAVKVMRKDSLEDMDMARYARREAAILRKLSHTNIVGFVEAIQSETKLFLVMEIASGVELLDIVSSGPLSEMDAKIYMRQLVDAVSYLHTKGIVHRDLKPDNVLVDIQKQRLKIIDFGLTGVIRKNAVMRTCCGSSYYSAPEVTYANGEGYDGIKADAWSLGVLAYILLTGSHPFVDADGELMITMMRQGVVEFPNYLSNGAVHFISRLLAIDARKRYSVAQVSLHPWLLGKSVSMNSSDENHRFQRLQQRRSYQHHVEPPPPPQYRQQLEQQQQHHRFSNRNRFSMQHHYHQQQHRQQQYRQRQQQYGENRQQNTITDAVMTLRDRERDRSRDRSRDRDRDRTQKGTLNTGHAHGVVHSQNQQVSGGLSMSDEESGRGFGVPNNNSNNNNNNNSKISNSNSTNNSSNNNTKRPSTFNGTNQQRTLFGRTNSGRTNSSGVNLTVRRRSSQKYNSGSFLWFRRQHSQSQLPQASQSQPSEQQQQQSNDCGPPSSTFSQDGQMPYHSLDMNSSNMLNGPSTTLSSCTTTSTTTTTTVNMVPTTSATASSSFNPSHHVNNNPSTKAAAAAAAAVRKGSLDRPKPIREGRITLDFINGRAHHDSLDVGPRVRRQLSLSNRTRALLTRGHSSASASDT